MSLNQKETAAIKDLQTQEKTCIDKYRKYSQEAKDTVLKDLFENLEASEQKHYDSLQQVINGNTPAVNCNDKKGKKYNPTATYQKSSRCQNKTHDCFLATDCIGTEKLVSSEYNNDVFVCSQPEVRKLLADIQIEEQNHAEMLYSYKTVNGMM